MEVETYEVEEEADTGLSKPELDAASLALIESLGLEGQRKLTVKAEDGAVKRIPYREMTAQEIAVYAEVFPEQTKLARYEAAPIPLRVLQVAAHAKEYLPFLSVWHRSIADKDPVLVGRREEYSRTIYLLARWGDALLPFTSLVAEAKRVLRIKWTEELDSKVRGIEEFRRAMDQKLELRCELGKDVSLYF